MTEYVDDLEEIVCNYSTVVELLRYRALQQADTEAFTLLVDEEAQPATLTYQELDRRTRAIASQLQALSLSGDRALLLYPPGLDFLPAFFGCLYAGVVAVPAYPPRNRRNTPRILAILEDAQAAVILTTSGILSQVQSLLADKFDIGNIHWLTTDNLTPGTEAAWREPVIDTDYLAFLQYTSGSTGTPKGVMLTHGNLLHNAEVTRQCMEHTSRSKFVTWLPVYHDMGLIGGILQPLYSGFPCIMIPPASFLQSPYRWLGTISRYRGTTSGAPNFAYELCIEKITPEQRSTLDLSSWTVAFNGAEPIRQHTLERFCATFAECGFRPEAFYPCYGMAEATLMVSGSVKAALVRSKHIDKSALESNYIVNSINDNSVALVSCGRTVPQQQIVIAHPETLTRAQDGEVGEIWVCGPSVGQGYWNRPTETEQTFQAFLQDTKEGPFLRTGDLGFLDNGEVFITGRAKDLIIIRGRNLYPQDIELTAERSHPALRLGSSAAFAVEVEKEEKLVVVQELEFRAKPNLEEVIAAIRQAVSQEFEVQVYGVVLIKGGTIPKTSSGKIQRRATKAEFLAGTLSIVYSSILDQADVSLPDEQPTNIEAYLQQLVAQVLSVPLQQVDIQQPLSNLGIDSLQAFDLKNRIQQDFGVSIAAVDLFAASIAQIVEQVLATEKTAISQQLQPIPRNCELPLCLAQERLWFLDQLEPGNAFYNVAIAIKLTGKLNSVILEQSLNEIIKRHESLRTSFAAIDGRPIQIIHKSLEVKLSILKDYDSDIQNLILQEAQQPFNLSQLPLLRAKLLQLKEDEHLLVITLHHIISDGWSIGVLIQELATIYAAFSVSEPSPLPELSIQYGDYAYWQRKWLQTDVLQPQLEYWKQQLSNSVPLLQLPTDRPRPEIQKFQGRKEFFTIRGEIKAAVKHLNQQEGVTLFMTLLAVFKTLLYCYTKQEDILVGSPVVGRNWRETEKLIGFFINTLVFRTDFSGNPSFRELLQRLRACALDAYAHQDLPFEKLVEELQPERSLSYNPLFQVMFILQNAPIPSVEIPGLNWQPEEVDIGTSKFDLKLSLWESEQGINGSFEYKVDLFDTTTIKRMVRHYESILITVLEKPDIQVNQLINLLAEVEQERKIYQEKELPDISKQKLKFAKRTVIGRN